MAHELRWIAVAAIGLAGATCANEDDRPTTASESPEEAKETSTSTTTSPPTTEAAEEEVATAVMPDLLCMNLQDAQDEIQSAGVFFSRSEDATGQNRSQIIDSNWIVVDQTPAPGATIGEGEAVLSAVKYGEEGGSC